MLSSRAPPPPSVEATESTSSYGDASPHISSISSEDLEHDVSQATQSAKGKASEFSEEAAEKVDGLSESASKNYEKGKAAAAENYDKGKAAASKKSTEAKEKAVVAKDDYNVNRDNPVVIGNTVIVAVVAAVLGFGAYHKHTRGELNWTVVGTWAGVVGLFGVGDYYFSQ